jgi:hypothetical protein
MTNEFGEFVINTQLCICLVEVVATSSVRSAMFIGGPSHNTGQAP